MSDKQSGGGSPRSSSGGSGGVARSSRRVGPGSRPSGRQAVRAAAVRRQRTQAGAATSVVGQPASPGSSGGSSSSQRRPASSAGSRARVRRASSGSSSARVRAASGGSGRTGQLSGRASAARPRAARPRVGGSRSDGFHVSQRRDRPSSVRGLDRASVRGIRGRVDASSVGRPRSRRRAARPARRRSSRTGVARPDARCVAARQRVESSSGGLRRAGWSGPSRAGGDRVAARAAGSRDSRASRPDSRPAPRDSGVRDPPIPEGVEVTELDRVTLNSLRTLPDGLAEIVALHLAAAARLLADDPELALAHTRAASRRAGRVAIVREAVGCRGLRRRGLRDRPHRVEGRRPDLRILGLPADDRRLRARAGSSRAGAGPGVVAGGKHAGSFREGRAAHRGCRRPARPRAGGGRSAHPAGPGAEVARPRGSGWPACGTPTPTRCSRWAAFGRPASGSCGRRRSIPRGPPTPRSGSASSTGSPSTSSRRSRSPEDVALGRGGPRGARTEGSDARARPVRWQSGEDGDGR